MELNFLKFENKQNLIEILTIYSQMLLHSIQKVPKLLFQATRTSKWANIEQTKDQMIWFRLEAFHKCELKSHIIHLMVVI